MGRKRPLRFVEYSRRSRFKILRGLRDQRQPITFSEDSSDSEGDNNVFMMNGQKSSVRVALQSKEGPSACCFRAVDGPAHDGNTSDGLASDSNLNNSNHSTGKAQCDPSDALDSSSNVSSHTSSPSSDSSEDDGDLSDSAGSGNPHHDSEGDDNDNYTESSSEGGDDDAEPSFESDGNTEPEDPDPEGGDDSEPEDHDPEGDNDPPLFPGAPLSQSESMIAILSVALHHQLTGACLADILNLIALHCPQPSPFHKSLYMFKKFFADMRSALNCHYYCSQCLGNLMHKNDICGRCQENKGVQYFITVPLLTQLQSLYERPGFTQKLSYRLERVKEVNENYEDVYDGAVYAEISRQGEILSNRPNISLTWNTDGISVYKSSKFSIWPFYLSIQELSYSERTKLDNVILAGLWFGSRKPLPNLFLRPLEHEVNRLKSGVNFITPTGPVFVKGIIIGGTCDLPAKALFLNMKQFNSVWGCQKCKIESVPVRPNQNTTRLYLFQRNLELRTDEETERFAAEAVARGESVLGVKGPTILRQLVRQPIRSTVCDEMHAVYQGTTKKLLTLWFDEKYRNERWSLHMYLEIIDNRLLNIRPPQGVQRLPRSIKTHLKYWKASELKLWLFYYSVPILNNIMKEFYFSHFKLLVLGVYLLSGNSVSEQAVNLSTILLTEFNSRFEHLYDRTHMSCNLHQLLHLPENVKDFGPLWAMSCFPFESLNGKLKKPISGTRYADLQVCSAAAIFLNLATLRGKKLHEGNPVYNFVKRICNFNHRMKLTEVTNSMSAVGKLHWTENLPPLVRDGLQRERVVGNNFHLFYRLYIKASNTVVVSQSYNRTLRTNSSCVKFTTENRYEFGFVQSFVRVSNCQCRDICNHGEDFSYAIIRKCEVAPVFLVLPGLYMNYIHEAHLLDDVVAVEISRLKSVCFFAEVTDDNALYIIEPVNSVESE